MKRRLFLTGVGGAALATPFLSSLQRPARAAQDLATSPRRMVIFYTQNGCLTNRWFPKVEDGPIDASALAGTTLEGLSPFASQLLFPRGLAMFPRGNVTVNGVSYFDPHDQGMGSKLTCAPIDSDPEGQHYALGRSLDHVAAELVNQGSSSPLVLSVGGSFGGTTPNVKQVLSYSAAQTPYVAESNPANVYQSLTEVFVGGDPTSEADYRVAQGESIIDLVRGDLESFQRLNMSQSDQQKVKDWLDLLRETEVKVVSAACNADNAAAIGITSDTVNAAAGRGFDLATAFTLGGDMMLNLIALSMMCDTNRSIVMHWPGFVVFDWDDIHHEFDHHGLSHRVGSAATSGPCVDGVIDMINEIDTWYAARYVKLVELLDGLPDADGNTLLHNSAVMWLPELADGNAHNNNNLPIVIAGSCGGYLKQGVSINLEGGSRELGTGNSEAVCTSPGEDVSFTTGSNGGNVPLNKLYVTLLNALGATNGGSPITEFGMCDSNDVEAGITQPGELAELKA